MFVKNSILNGHLSMNRQIFEGKKHSVSLLVFYFIEFN